MKNKKEYWIEFNSINREKQVQIEKIIRKFLLSKSNNIRLTRIQWYEFLPPKKLGTDEDLKFIGCSKNLEKSLIKRILANWKYNHIIQSKENNIEHYIYKITNKIRLLINKETLFWNSSPPNSIGFYGFEDPTFYKKDELIGGIISHEKMIYINLSDNEKKSITKKGIGLYLLDSK